jgi:2-dehydropantoate 2-reductase
MKIAVVGCGAVGSFYGARFARAGHEVHFLLRSDYEVVRRQGVRVESPEGGFMVQPRCAQRPEGIGPADLVLIGLKTTANDQFPVLLPPVVGPATAVLTLQNGLGNEEQLARLFPVEQIMGGLCFVCLNRIAPGVIRHLGYGQVVLGEFQRPPGSRTRELAAQFKAAGVSCKIAENLAQSHWEKLVWNIPFNGLGVAGAAGPEVLEQLCSAPLHEPGSRGRESSPSQAAAAEGCLALASSAAPRASPPQGSFLGSCLSTDQLLGDEHWARLVRELMLEIISAAQVLGFAVPERYADELIARTRSMGAYRASTLIDFERGQALELDSLFLEPLRQATRAGATVARLSALCAVLTQAQRSREARGTTSHDGTACATGSNACGVAEPGPSAG